MDEVNYKLFTPEEEKIYEQAIGQMKDNMANGLSFNEALQELPLADAEMRKIIKEDYLKILIADLHFSKRKSFEEIAETLNVPYEDVKEAQIQMIEDVKIASIQAYRASQQQQGNT
jgi:hypothetical protein